MEFAVTGAKVDPKHEPEVAALSWQRNQWGHLRHFRRVDGKVKNLFSMHQFVWHLEHGEWPRVLEHINKDPSDNRLCNLRQVTPKLNHAQVTEKQPLPLPSSDRMKALRDLLDEDPPHVTEPAVTREPLDLDYEERAAIMEFDGGLSRAEAEFEAALRSTVPLVTEPLSVTQPSETREKLGCVTVAPVTPLGGKHAASLTQGDVSLTADQIMDAWRKHWGS